MSPASSGPLEVEKYIGACLISSHSRTKNPTTTTKCTNQNRDIYYPRDAYDVYNTGYIVDNRYRTRRCATADGWAGGMPLISFANNRNNRNRRIENDSSGCVSPSSPDGGPQQNPLARLAVHTQGLPLILSGRHGNRSRTKTATRNILPQVGRNFVEGTNAKKIPSECKDNTVNGVDALSVTSDESSGSNNSENSLPRIIKPRKRRKKDRKPHPSRNQPDGINDRQTPDSYIGSSNIVTLKPYIPYCYKRYEKDRINNNGYKNKLNNIVQVPDDELDVIRTDISSETPQLHHRFEDVLNGLDEDGAVDDSGEPSSCQCRYCDPAGQIWDVDRHCYSPFLTNPTFTEFPLSERISSALQSQCLISTTFSNIDEENDKCRPNRTKSLEISTTIVTSPNGHRDLEIRLFSDTYNDEPPPTSKLINKCSELCSIGDVCDQNLSPEE